MTALTQMSLEALMLDCLKRLGIGIETEVGGGFQAVRWITEDHRQSIQIASNCPSKKYAIYRAFRIILGE
jgi:hypothetical protein